MKKLLIASALTLIASVSTLPSISAYSYTYHTVKSSSQYLGQTVNTNGQYEGWYKFNDGTWGYYIEYGKLVKDSQLDFADGMYVIGEDGRMITGWTSDDQYDYFFNSDGRAQKGWLQSDGYWYYFDNDYHMQTGWQYINQKWYYFDEETGVMATNVKIGDYYVTSDGSLQ